MACSLLGFLALSTNIIPGQAGKARQEQILRLDGHVVMLRRKKLYTNYWLQISGREGERERGREGERERGREGERQYNNQSIRSLYRCDHGNLPEGDGALQLTSLCKLV